MSGSSSSGVSSLSSLEKRFVCVSVSMPVGTSMTTSPKEPVMASVASSKPLGIDAQISR